MPVILQMSTMYKPEGFVPELVGPFLSLPLHPIVLPFSAYVLAQGCSAPFSHGSSPWDRLDPVWWPPTTARCCYGLSSRKGACQTHVLDLAAQLLLSQRWLCLLLCLQKPSLLHEQHCLVCGGTAAALGAVYGLRSRLADCVHGCRACCSVLYFPCGRVEQHSEQELCLFSTIRGKARAGSSCVHGRHARISPHLKSIAKATSAEYCTEANFV